MMMKLEEMIEQLDQSPLGSRERTDGIQDTDGSFIVKVNEPALLYMQGGVLGFGPNVGKPGGGYRLEIRDSNGEIIYIQNSPNKNGLIEGIQREIETSHILLELV